MMKILIRFVMVFFPILLIASVSDNQKSATTKKDGASHKVVKSPLQKIDPSVIQKLRLEKQQGVPFNLEAHIRKGSTHTKNRSGLRAGKSWLSGMTPSFLKKRHSSITTLPGNSAEDAIQILFNGSADTTYTVGDTLTITVIFSTGEDSALMGGYLDNGDGILDTSSDIWLFKDEDEGNMWIFDNDDEDENDSTGIWEVTFIPDEVGKGRDMRIFLLEGASLFFTVTDGGGTTTAHLDIEGIESEFSISGVVIPATTNIFIFAIPSWSIEFEEDEEPSEIWAAITDTNGSYVLHVREPGLYYVFASDFMGITDPQLFPEEFWQWVDVSGVTTDIDFNLVEANAWIAGYVEDQDGTPVSELTIWTENGPFEAEATTDADGYYYLGVMAWNDPSGAGWWETKWKIHLDEDALWPDYMIPHGRGIIVHPGELVDDPEETHYTLFVNDTTITGTITLPDGFQIDCFGVYVDHQAFEVYNWIDFCEDSPASPVDYSIPVSSYLDDYGEYWLGIWVDEPEDSVISIPENYHVFSGEMGVDFDLIMATAWVEGHVYSAQDGYDIKHAWVHFQNDSISVGSGTGRDGYFIVPLLGDMDYEMDVDAEGFEHYHEDSIHVSIDEVQWMDIPLEYSGWGEVRAPELYSVEDFPDDQGGKVRIRWTAGDPGPLGYFTGYSIWRHVPDSGWDPPLWDFIRMVPWHGYDDYSTVVPTLGNATPDDTTWTTFMVSAHTEDPNWFFDSNPLDGFSVDNLVPHTPGNLQLSVVNETFLLTWSHPVDEDFQYFAIYRNMEQIDVTVDTFFTDVNIDPTATYEYWVTAFDFNGNESAPSESVTGSLSIENGLVFPETFALFPNYPNPFNPETTIRYDLPEKSNVSIVIYDLLGRQVRMLTNGWEEPGYKAVTWDATDDFGQPVGAGLYLYHIKAGDFSQTRKMLLLK